MVGRGSDGVQILGVGDGAVVVGPGLVLRAFDVKEGARLLRPAKMLWGATINLNLRKSAWSLISCWDMALSFCSACRALDRDPGNLHQRRRTATAWICQPEFRGTFGVH